MRLQVVHFSSSPPPVQISKSTACPLLVKMHSKWWCLLKKCFVAEKLLLSCSVSDLFVTPAVSTETNKMHYFQSNLRSIRSIANLKLNSELSLFIQKRKKG